MMMTATATEVQNNFGKYLQMAQAGGEVIVVKNGKEVAKRTKPTKPRPLFVTVSAFEGSIPKCSHQALYNADPTDKFQM